MNTPNLDPQPYALYATDGVLLKRYPLEWPGFVLDPRPEYSQNIEDYE